MSSESELPSDAPRPRLCILRKWSDFPGYGFNLHAEKNTPGQFIGRVDEGSPAEAAHLKDNDRLIEVNGINVCNENHQQVVTRIKTNPDEVSLLVIEQDGEQYYQKRSIRIHGVMPSVVRYETPLTKCSDIEAVPTEEKTEEAVILSEVEVQPQDTAHVIEENGTVTYDLPQEEKMNVQIVREEEMAPESDGKSSIDGSSVASSSRNTEPTEAVTADASLVVQSQPVIIPEPAPTVEIESVPEVVAESNGPEDVKEVVAESNGPEDVKEVVAESNGPENNKEMVAETNGKAAPEEPVLNLNLTAAEMRQRLSISSKKRAMAGPQSFKDKAHLFHQL